MVCIIHLYESVLKSYIINMTSLTEQIDQ